MIQSLSSLKDFFIKTVTGVPSFPNYICLEVTNACNLRCVHCLYQGGKKSHYERSIGHIDLKLSLKILDQLKENNAGVMLNGDGEPLLHPNFHEIAQYATRLELPEIFFNTNGTLFSKNFTDEFIKYYKGSVSFSLDGFKESHERLRVGSSYDKVKTNIEYLLQGIQEKNAPIKVSVAYCNYDQPVEEKDAFIKYWIERVYSVSIGEVYNKDYQLISKQINRQKYKERLKCEIPWSTFIVRYDGIVVPCSNCFSSGAVHLHLGDSNNQALKKIWHGKKLKDLRYNTRKWQIKGTICEKCERWNMFVQYGERNENGLIVSRSGVFTTYRKPDFS